jgi:hypothetical protein
MSEQAAPLEGGIVENLATQFSNATDCFRELVQNSIDAGSPQVEVWTEYEAGSGHQGVIAIHVDDFGEGMDEQIIDNQLTKLFASAKEGDLTKIGKFGIGFVSIFAMRPQAVLMHTGRGGDCWEVLFHADRSFTKTKLDIPVEGTQITLFVEGDVQRYHELVREVHKALERWCTHSEAEITFEDRSSPDARRVTINRPFTVYGRNMVRVEYPGTEIVLAYSHSPTYSFYNRGLMLFHSTQAEAAVGKRHRRYGHIAFKIKSRYLEHTLSRESLVQDEHFERAMVLLDRAADGQLLDGLLAELEALVAAPRWSVADVGTYNALMDILAHEPSTTWRRIADRAIFAMLRGPAMSLNALYETWRARGSLLFSEGAGELIDQLAQQDIPIVFGRKAWGSLADLGSPARVFTRYAGMLVDEQLSVILRRKLHEFMPNRPVLDSVVEVTQTLATPDEQFLRVRVDESRGALDGLITRTQHLLSQVGHDYRRVATCRVSSTELEPPLFVIGPSISALMMRPPRLGTLKRKLFRSPWHGWEIAINREHPHLLALARLWEREPGMAAYCLARALFLTEDLPLDQTLGLIAHAREEGRDVHA